MAEKNFFETRVTEYQTGSSLKWGEEEEKNSQGKNKQYFAVEKRDEKIENI